MSNLESPRYASESEDPFVVCSKYGTCRMSCASSCNTRRLKNPPLGVLKRKPRKRK